MKFTRAVRKVMHYGWSFSGSPTCVMLLKATALHNHCDRSSEEKWLIQERLNRERSQEETALQHDPPKRGSLLPPALVTGPGSYSSSLKTNPVNPPNRKSLHVHCCLRADSNYVCLLLPFFLKSLLHSGSHKKENSTQMGTQRDF